MTKTLLKANEVAEYLGCSLASVWRYAKNGTIPAPLKIGDLTRWRLEDIEQLVARDKQVAA